MKILLFHGRSRRATSLLGRIESLNDQMDVYRESQSRQYEERRRLAGALERLSLLGQECARRTESLRRSAARLRACDRRPWTVTPD